jgi:hypothetical protein
MLNQISVVKNPDLIVIFCIFCQCYVISRISVTREHTLTLVLLVRRITSVLAHYYPSGLGILRKRLVL